MGYQQRSILYNRLIESTQRVETLIGALKEDVQESLRNMDDNFPNKIQKLEGQLNKVQLIENQFTELVIELYNFEL